jgi:hypothetical protein
LHPIDPAGAARFFPSSVVRWARIERRARLATKKKSKKKKKKKPARDRYGRFKKRR